MENPPLWRETYQPARLETLLEGGEVQCNLSPRRCRIREGGVGVCGVRGNVGGRLVTFSYGKGVHLTEEVIETEAVFHYAPGARTLSLGNIGCNLNCSYCQNWKTSQSRYVEDGDIYAFSPEQVVETAVRHGIRVLSWTYNDPVVWHEFVLDTARLAREAGLINLFKSAFYITPEAVEELLPVIDIFTLSIKSINPGYYRQLTGGRVEPVLEAVRQVHRAGKHLEVSNLMVTDISDDEASARQVIEWILNHLDVQVPTHFARFHPEYRLTQTCRTPVENLQRARRLAQSMGLAHVYLGNVLDVEATSTTCRVCGSLQVRRFGLNTRVVGLDGEGRCRHCQAPSGIRMLPALQARPRLERLPKVALQSQVCHWRGEIASFHVQLHNTTPVDTAVYYRLVGGADASWSEVALGAGEHYRFVLGKDAPEDTGVELRLPEGVVLHWHEVYDRAHFPTIPIEVARSESDATALPHFEGRALSAERLATLRRSLREGTAAADEPEEEE
ncbi:MAG: AmmeMemoRadiSam system radical SAM enzyme [Magnetococcales bacterium]|nr:AmmeMemoRadiSam system radical SAM enzyme [Magnetococcales bacterium]